MQTQTERGAYTYSGKQASMKPELHKAAVQGSVASLRSLAHEDPNILSSKTPRENTALHIAAGLGHTDFAREVIAMDGDLLVRKNDDGDTPLHLAARSGKLDVAVLLIDVIRLAQACWKEEPLLMTNKEGNTPLHVAVKHRKSALALKLLEDEPSRGHALNARKQSPLHIAAREGLADVVAKIVELPWVPEEFKPSASVSGTALHQAVLGGHTRVVEILLKRPGMIDLTDSSGDNALHYAAQKDDARMVKMLLNHKPDMAYERNGERQMSPLHVAADYSSTKAMKELLRQCPDVAEMLDGKGRNAIHTAVSSGKVDALKCLLHHVRPEEVVNRADAHGNTPLHLAAKMIRIRSALMLLKDSRVDPCLLNRYGHSARSLVEDRAAAEGMDTYVMYLWKQLKKHEASRCKNHQLPPAATYQSLRGRKASGHDEYFELSVGTYTLVATLIATVTFAATFTMPGGYNQVDGTAIHGHRVAFKIFVISNTVAMCSAIVVVFCFIWAWRDPVKFKLDQLMWGHRLTVVACLAMVVSLMTAVYITVVPTARWPAYVVIAIGASTPAAVFLILGKEAFYVPL